MSFEDDLRSQLRSIFGTAWKEREGRVVPEPEDIELGKDAVTLDGTVLYADLADSTGMVTSKRPEFSAEVYKAYLDSACRVIRKYGGVITAFDGDRVMAVFIGGNKNTAAVRSALGITWATKIVNEELKKRWTTDLVVQQGIGVDTSKLFVAKTGIRGSNDLVWVGRAANYAAKLCSLRSGAYDIWITDDIYYNMNEETKYAEKDSNGTRMNMWESHRWSDYDRVVFKSKWQWRVP